MPSLTPDSALDLPRATIRTLLDPVLNARDKETGQFLFLVGKGKDDKRPRGAYDRLELRRSKYRRLGVPEAEIDEEIRKADKRTQEMMAAAGYFKR